MGEPEWADAVNRASSGRSPSTSGGKTRLAAKAAPATVKVLRLRSTKAATSRDEGMQIASSTSANANASDDGTPTDASNSNNIAKPNTVPLALKNP